MSDSRTTADAVKFAGLIFRGLHSADLFPHENEFKFIVTVNADFIVNAARDTRFKQLISSNHATFDGQVTWWLARLLGRPRGVTFEKISGSSFALELLEHAAAHGLRVFFLGASSTVNEAAVRAARARYGVDVSGYSPSFGTYPGTAQWNTQILDQLKAHAPHILLVAFGSPKQEFWIDDHRESLQDVGVRLAVGCGGTLDFLAGAVRRAPVTVQRLGLEGVYRLAMQPSWFRLKRLGRSLLVIPIAFWMSLSER